jgi:hypothetical protein
LLRLSVSPTAQRALVVKAGLAAARADGKVSEREDELLRRLCAIVDCPSAVLRPQASAARPVAQLAGRPLPDALAGTSRVDADEAAADDLPAHKPCGTCGGRMELRRDDTPWLYTLADWIVPALASLVVGAVILHSCGEMKCSAPGWAGALAGWIVLSLLGAFLWSAIADVPIDFMTSRRARIRMATFWVVAGVVILPLSSAPFGVVVAHVIFGCVMLAAALAAKPEPRGRLYMCLKCGHRTAVS